MTDSESSSAETDSESIPQFRLLPAEVRFLVWRHLVSEPLLLDFDIRSIPDDRHSERDRYRWVAIPGPYLSQRRRNLYSALQANRKSQFVALGLVPDTLAVPRGFIRFDKTRDFDGGPDGALPRAVCALYRGRLLRQGPPPRRQGRRRRPRGQGVQPRR